MNTPLVRITLTAAGAIWLAGFETLLAQTATWVENTPASSPLFAHHDMTYDETLTQSGVRTWAPRQVRPEIERVMERWERVVI